MATNRTARASSEWERAKRRRRIARHLDEVCGETERTMKGLAACGGVPDNKLRAMRRGDHGADLATVLGLPERVRDELFARIAGECDRRAWVETIDPEHPEEWAAMIERLRDHFEAAYRELREVAKEKRLTPERARRLLKPVRAVERIVVGVRVLAERVLGEEGDDER